MGRTSDRLQGSTDHLSRVRYLHITAELLHQIAEKQEKYCGESN